MTQGIGDTLRQLRQKQGYLQQEVADKLKDMGYPVAKSSVSRWENGYTSPGIRQFIALCRVYGVSDAFSVFQEGNLGELEYCLNREGREKLAEYRQLLIDSGRFAPERTERVLPFARPRRTRPLYDECASAGTGQFLDSDSYEMVEIGDDVPDEASFGLRVGGDSMEPTLRDGQEIWVHQQPTLENGQIGVFLLDGSAFVKEFRQTPEGAFLVSHNPAYAPIPLGEYSSVKVYGRVVFP